MSRKRMSDERLKWFGEIHHGADGFGWELYHALIAERAVVERVEVEAQSWRDLEPVAGNYYANRVQTAIHPQDQNT